MTGRRVTVQLDPVQNAWLEALADVHNCSRAQVLRRSLSYFSARESVRIARTQHYRVIGLAARAARWDPITDFLAERPISPP